jgi:hypothetical protein
MKNGSRATRAEKVNRISIHREQATIGDKVKTSMEMPSQSKRPGMPALKAHIRHCFLFATLLLTLASVLGPGVVAQGTTGSIKATVTDPSGAAVPGAIAII